jgi:DNA-binding MarR family transcriptional regulator
MTQASYASGLLFTQAHKVVRDRIYHILEKYELTPSYWSILGITVHAPEGIRLAAVAKEMEVKAPLVTMLSDDLVKNELIVRIPHHTDGRAKLLVATAKGKKLVQEVESELSKEIECLMYGITSSEAAIFQKSLEAIIANAVDELEK